MMTICQFPRVSVWYELIPWGEKVNSVLCCFFPPSKWRPHSEFYDFHILKLISHLYVVSSIPLTVLPLGIRASCWFIFLVAHPPSISDVKSACLSTPPVWFSTHSPRGFPFAHWFWSPSYFRPFYLHPTQLLCLL